MVSPALARTSRHHAGGRIALLASALALAAAPGLAPRDARSAPTIRLMPPNVTGFPLLFPRTTDTRPRSGALVAADLDGDGRAELIATIPSGVITIAGAGGTLPGWPRRLGGLPQPAWPVGPAAIGDLDGDGVAEVVVCVAAGAAPRSAILMAMRADGSDLPGWPIEIPSSDPAMACAPGGPVAVDLDGDGRAEVVQVVGAADVWAIDTAGVPLAGWPFRPGPDASGHRRPINAAPAAADLDGDGRAEVVVIESGNAPRLFALDAAGRTMPGFPVGLAEVVDRQAPAAADLDGDGRAEIVQATMPYAGDIAEPQPFARDPVPPPPLVPAALHTFSGRGIETPGWPHPMDDGGAWGAILADLDGDGLPDILQGEGDRLHAFDAAGATWPGFPLTVRRRFARAQARVDTQWAVADLDHDRHPDFLRALGSVESGATALRMVAIEAHGRPVRGFPFTLGGLLPESDPVAADLTGDGIPEVAILVGEGTNGGWRLLAWDVAGGLVGRLDGRTPAPEPAPVARPL